MDGFVVVCPGLLMINHSVDMKQQHEYLKFKGQFCGYIDIDPKKKSKYIDQLEVLSVSELSLKAKKCKVIKKRSIFLIFVTNF